MPKNRQLKITEKDFKWLMECKGLTIHGIPLSVSERYAYETREMDRGYEIFRFFQAFAHLHTDRAGRKRYVCHPSRRGELESELRKN